MWWTCDRPIFRAPHLLFVSILTVVIWGVLSTGTASGSEWVRRSEAPKVREELADRMAMARESDQYEVWVFFTDKNIRSRAAYEAAIRTTRARMDERAIRRRRKVGAEMGFEDLPVCAAYVNRVRESGVAIRTVSRWFNGLSIRGTRRQIERLAELPFVRAIEPVRKYRRTKGARSQEIRPKGMVPRTMDYGPSYDQLAQIRVPDLHERGYTGRGVRICMLDSGFNYREHAAFSRTKVIAERDFLYGDACVSDEPGQDGTHEGALSQGEHGAWTLSVIGAYREGHLIGVAHDSEFLLAKTEDVRNELPIEEDYWIAGLEWADSLGADVVNSSVGYTTWDDGTGYAYEDLNGDVARTTIAADLAAFRGIVVVVSAGNEGSKSWRYLNVPADGDSVVAVGAVDDVGDLAGFSSVGPTSDGRIKPDVVAMGMGVYCADSGSPDAYQFRSGTSFSAPLVAGVCALLLEIHPEWGPVEVADALRSTARDLGPSGPDTLYGWGLVDALAASGLEEEEPIQGSDVVFLAPFPNPSSDAVHFPTQLPRGGTVALEVFTVSGERVFRGDQTFYPGAYTRPGRAVVWDGCDPSGHPVGSGIYFYRLRCGSEKRRGAVAIAR